MTREQAVDVAVRRQLGGLVACLKTWHEEGQDEMDDLLQLCVTAHDVHRVRRDFRTVVGQS